MLGKNLDVTERGFYNIHYKAPMFFLEDTLGKILSIYHAWGSGIDRKRKNI